MSGAEITFLPRHATQRAQIISADFRVNTTAPHDSLVMGIGTLAGERVYVLAQDARVEGGSFGEVESDAVALWFAACARAPAPIVMMLDSGGARMSEGLAALGGFRRMFAAACDAWLAGLPMIALCGRTVFGGATMLACLAQQRAFFERSLFGMSGPRIVQAVAGVADFNAEDKAFVHSVMGGPARQGLPGHHLLADDAAAVSAFLISQVTAIKAQDKASTLSRLQHILIVQRAQLESNSLTRSPRPQAAAQAWPHFARFATRYAEIDGGVLMGRTRDEGYVYGLINGVWADSWDAWKLANALLTQLEMGSNAASHLPTLIVMDCPAHATSRALEAGLISQYFTLLGLAVRAVHAVTGNVQLIITGEAAGGVHVALAGGASRVLGLPQANVRILPRIAIDQVRPDAPEQAPSTIDYLHCGVIDAIIST
jgi:acetyl-CoA carboxylase beta subunit